MTPDTASVLQLKVVLRGTRPPIWRRLLVPSSITLERFHHILQVVMGWTDSHLHEFRAGDTRYGTPEPDWDEDEVVSERRVRLGELLQEPKDRLLYAYDFGDSWEHDIVLEKILARAADMKYPYVLAGKRACPPEDVGGTWGYEEFLETIRNPKHPEHEDRLAWCGGSFDPEAFDVQAINRAFHGGWAPATLPEERPAAPKRKATPKLVGFGVMAQLPTAKILSEDEVTAVSEGLRGLLGEEFLRVSKGFDLDAFVRFQAVAEKCRQTREARGVAVKQAAQALGVRQEDLRRIEGASVGQPQLGPARRDTSALLGLQRWFGRWKAANPDAVARLGLAAPRTK